MFNNKPDKTPEIMNNKNPETTSASINLIGTGTTIEGDLKSNGDVRIDGNVYGSVQSKAKAVIGATGVVDGDITLAGADRRRDQGLLGSRRANGVRDER